MHSNLFLRIVSAVILAPFVLGSIWYGRLAYEEYSIPLYPIFLAIFGTALAWEWGHMFKKEGASNQLLIALTACLTAFLTEGNPLFVLWVILVGTTAVFWKSGCRIKFALGVPYICLPILSLGYIFYINENISREIVLWLFFVVWATDIGGYIVGKTIGGPKLAPKISAKKTWAGLFGGIFFAMGVAYVFALYLKANGLIPASAEYYHHLTRVLVLSAGGLAIVSQAGDFFESAIKRKLNIKDSSDLIPGHGGVFDRVDGLLFASVATAAALSLVNSGIF
jgi:phosphatidate cytidylyltransferase